MRILFCGDIAISGVDNFEYSDEVKTLFNEQDLVVGNLEAVITKSDNKLPLHPAYLKTDFHSLNLLDPFKVLCIANNHTLDYQDEGLKDTINHLDKMGISHFGAGKDSNQANKPLLLEKEGRKIAFLAFTRFANATMHKYGTADSNMQRNLREIKRLKREGYLIIVMPHWGYEHVPFPAPRQRILARRMIRKGADIVLGTHPHVHQGYEMIDGKLIIYSLGNFIFASRCFAAYNDWKTQKSVMVEIIFGEGRSYDFRLIPYHSTDLGLKLLSGEEEAFVINSVNSVRRVLDNGYLKYLKLYFQHVRFTVEFNKRALKRQLSSGSQKSSISKKIKKIIKIYSKANWQDALNRFYKPMLFALRKVDTSSWEETNAKNEK